MQNHLFNAVDPSSTFNDLVAFNIQRARDHGIPDWNTCRGQLGLTVFSSFNDSRLKLEMSAANIDLLYSIYGANGINDTDPFVGGLATAVLPPTLLVGPLLGIAATYVVDNGGLEGVKRLPIFNKK